jgi:hypothetical protein
VDSGVAEGHFLHLRRDKFVALAEVYHFPTLLRAEGLANVAVERAITRKQYSMISDSFSNSIFRCCKWRYKRSSVLPALR